MNVRILIVEDQAMVSGALRALLETEPGFEVVGQAASGSEALVLTVERRPDIVLADIEMPGTSGLELAAELRRRHARIRVVILTTFARPGYLQRALQAGVAGYLLKDAPADTLAAALREVHAGGRAIAPDLAAAAWEEDPLTERERQVLRRAGEGMSNADIAAELELSQGTVRNYLSEAIGKLGAANRTEAARLARRKGWL